MPGITFSELKMQIFIFLFNIFVVCFTGALSWSYTGDDGKLNTIFINLIFILISNINVKLNLNLIQKTYEILSRTLPNSKSP